MRSLSQLSQLSPPQPSSSEQTAPRSTSGSELRLWRNLLSIFVPFLNHFFSHLLILSPIYFHSFLRPEGRAASLETAHRYILLELYWLCSLREVIKGIRVFAESFRMMMKAHAAATLSSCSTQVGAGAVGTAFVNSRVECQRFAPLQPSVSFQRRPPSRLLMVRGQGQSTGKPSDESYVDYEGKGSVFPDEACEDTGEGCDGEGVFKEVLPKAVTAAAAAEQTSGPDREYEEYAGAKTVFPGEACEELGGEFCGPEFQEGVFADKVQASK